MTDLVAKDIHTGELGKFADPAFRGATAFFALVVLIILGGVIVSLVDGALPALRSFGWGFLATDSGNPGTEKFGALVPIYEPDATTATAMLIGIPVAIDIAPFITALSPARPKRPPATLNELLAPCAVRR